MASNAFLDPSLGDFGSIDPHLPRGLARGEAVARPINFRRRRIDTVAFAVYHGSARHRFKSDGIRCLGLLATVSVRDLRPGNQHSFPQRGRHCSTLHFSNPRIAAIVLFEEANVP